MIWLIYGFTLAFCQSAYVFPCLACATFFASVCTTITRQPIELESCSNPLKMREVL